jgi:hypothetical protein
MDHKGLRILLVAHGFITLAAGIVLAVAPAFVPSVVGIHLEPSAYLVAYLLAGAEFGFAALSFSGSRLTDPKRSESSYGVVSPSMGRPESSKYTPMPESRASQS